MVETENPLGFVADTFAPTLNLREAVPIMNPRRNNVLLEYNRILLTIQRNSRWLTVDLYKLEVSFILRAKQGASHLAMRARVIA
jgi:hypothetical protein